MPSDGDHLVNQKSETRCVEQRAPINSIGRDDEMNVRSVSKVAAVSKPMPWFRMYTDFLSDPKMVALAFEDQRHFMGICALKCEGVLDQDCDDKILDRIVAQRLWIDGSVIIDVKKRLVNGGLIDKFWQPLAWEKRQKPSDHDPSGAARQKRYRESKNHQPEDETTVEPATERTGNAESNADSNALRNADGDASVTLPEERRGDKSREEKKNTSSGKPDMPDMPGFKRFWSLWPKSDRKVAKAACAKKWKARGLEVQAERIVASVEFLRRSKQWRDGFEPAPLTFLNQERWKDNEAEARKSDWWVDRGYGSEEMALRAGCRPDEARAA